MDASTIAQRVRERFPHGVLGDHRFRGDETLCIRAEEWLAVCRHLREDPAAGFHLIDLTAVDYLAFGTAVLGDTLRPIPPVDPSLRRRPPAASASEWITPSTRFEVVVHLLALASGQRLRLRLPVNESTLRVPSLTDLWPGANWYEREVWDMFGIAFDGHPNLKRLLMYDEFTGHPLRKDYPFNTRQPRLPLAPPEGSGRPARPSSLLDSPRLGNGQATEMRRMFLNVGPSHPAMHGVIQLILELEGERIMGADLEIGYLHRAFEKMCEQGPYGNAMPYVDRLNYVSPLINNFGYCLTVEKLLGIAVTERCQYIRVIMSEISRITDHLTCIGASAMELGTFTVFLYMIKAREFLYELVEAVTGARLTVSYGRIGGVKADLPDGFAEQCRKRLTEVRQVLKEVDGLLTRNRIFFDRMKDVGVLSREQAIGYGITGPFARASGVNYDVRKAAPHFVYDRMQFDVPLGEHGDNLDRYYVRMEEMEQSMRIITQALDQIPGGEVNVDDAGRVMPAAEMADRGKFGQTSGLKQLLAKTDPTLEGSGGSHHRLINVGDRRVILPPKEETFNSIEGLMQHFKLVMIGHGLRPPQGEVYGAVEGANGELGFYVVSDGSDRPFRVRVHPPCFPIMAALPEMLVGDLLADVVPTFGSINMIAGELDR